MGTVQPATSCHGHLVKTVEVWIILPPKTLAVHSTRQVRKEFESRIFPSGEAVRQPLTTGYMVYESSLLTKQGRGEGAPVEMQGKQEAEQCQENLPVRVWVDVVYLCHQLHHTLHAAQ